MKRLLAPAFSVILLAGCITGDKSAGRGTVVENELRTGFIYLADGHPAAGARVRVFPVSYVPDSAALPKKAAGSLFSTRTDDRGRFQLDSLPAGEYNILGESDGLYSLQDSVFLSPRTDSVPSDTLDKPGSLTGIVVLQPQDDPRSVVVQALGTNSYANVGEDGRFTLGNLGAGRYTLRVVTTLDEYTPLIVPAGVRAGKADTLADSLVLPFTGIPVVQGLRAVYDTLSGVVTLSWHPVHYRSFSEYQIFRDRSPAFTLSETAIASTRDTIFRDTWNISPPSAAASYAKWEYRVRVNSLTDRTGPAYGKVVVDVVDPATITTHADLMVASVSWDSAAKRDDYLIIARLTNPMRAIKRIMWSLGSPDATPTVRELGSQHQETDSLAFHWDQQGPFTVYVATLDDGNNVVKDLLRIAGNQAPTLSGSPVLHAYTSLPYRFAPTAADPDGDRIRFSIAGKPAWAAFDSLSGILQGTPPAGLEGSYPGITLTVSDGRRSTSLPPFDLLINNNPHTLMKPFHGDVLWKSPAIAGTGGKIYAVHDWPEGLRVMSIAEYNPTTEIWNKPDLVTDSPDTLFSNETISKTFNANGLIFIQIRGILWSYDPVTKASRIVDRGMTGYGFLGVVEGKGYFVLKSQTYPFETRVVEYDFGTRQATPKAILPSYLADRVADNDFEGVSINGKLFIICGFHNIQYAPPTPYYLYDPKLDAWSLPATNPRFRANTTQCAVNGKIYVAGGELYNNGKLGYMDEYDPDHDTWRPVSGLLSYNKDFIRCAEANGKAYFMFGEAARNDDTTLYQIESYDPSLEK